MEPMQCENHTTCHTTDAQTNVLQPPTIQPNFVPVLGCQDMRSPNYTPLPRREGRRRYRVYGRQMDHLAETFECINMSADVDDGQ